MFNNKAFKSPKIRVMNIQMTRLYEAAKVLHGAEGPSAVAKLMNLSPQTVKNWEARPKISDEGLLLAQEFIGCDAIWLRDGTGHMTAQAGDLKGDQIVELITLFTHATARERDGILNLARTSSNRRRVAKTGA